MLVKLTNAKTKMDLYLEANIILIVQKAPNSLTETMVTTSLMTQQGPVAFHVSETPAEVGRAVNEAHSGGKAASALRLN